MRVLALALSFISTTACSAAYADQPGPRRQIAMTAPRTALALAPERVRAPYDVTLVADDGTALPTYAKDGRYYVLGDVGDRYIIRVANPTPNRVEAVVSVDGLDVIDGEGGDLRKRGYIVPPYGDLRIEGFRTSQSDVATFRFSSVGGSYAGRKGKARNVGVIAVALFEEQAAPEIVEDEEIAYNGHRRGYDYRDDLASRAPAKADTAPGAARAKRPAPAREEASAEAPADYGGGARGGAVASRPAMPAPPPSPMPSGDRCCDEPRPTEAKRDRLGLGTEFGEQRYSAASYTRFVRAGDKPIAIAELRYNDRAGLSALGLPLAPTPDEDEIMLRETADPFPGDRFARPPSP